MAWTYSYIIITSFIGIAFAQYGDDDNELVIAKYRYLKMFKLKCEKNGHPEAYDNIQANALFFVSCMGSLLNTDVILEEIDDDPRFYRKYCSNTPRYKKCFRDMSDALNPCFAAGEQKNFKVLYNITDQIIEYCCYKEGQKFGSFLAEGGKECFEERIDDMIKCFDVVFELPNQIQNFTNIDDFFNLEFKEKQCNQMTALQKCIIGEIDKCEKPIVADLVNSMLSHIKDSTPCTDDGKKTVPGAASGLAITTSILFMAVIVTIIL